MITILKVHFGKSEETSSEMLSVFFFFSRTTDIQLFASSGLFIYEIDGFAFSCSY